MNCFYNIDVLQTYDYYFLIDHNNHERDKKIQNRDKYENLTWVKYEHHYLNSFLNNLTNTYMYEMMI